MPGARYSLGSFPEGAVSPFGAHADGETEGVALIFVSLFPPTAVLFLRPVSCSFLSEITKLSLLRKRGEGTEKSFDLPWRGETDQIKISSLSSRKRKGARSNKKSAFPSRKRGEPAQTKSALSQCKRRGVRLNKKRPSSMQKKGCPFKQKAPFLNTKEGERKQKNSSSARPHGGGFICQNSVVTGAGRFGTSRLELNVESNFRCDQVGRSLQVLFIRSALRPFGEIVRWSVLLIRDLPCLMGNEVDHIKRTSRYEILSEKISPLCGSACFPRLPLPLGSHGHWSSPR